MRDWQQAQHRLDKQFQQQRQSLENQGRRLEALAIELQARKQRLEQQESVVAERDSRTETLQRDLEQFLLQQAKPGLTDTERLDGQEQSIEGPGQRPELAISAAATSVQEHGQAISKLMDEFRQVLLGTIEERLVISQLHAELCEVREDREIEQLSAELRSRLRGAINLAEETLHRFRGEVDSLMAQVQVRLRELSVEEQLIMVNVRNKMNDLRAQWLRIDAAHPLSAPRVPGSPATSPARVDLNQP